MGASWELTILQRQLCAWHRQTIGRLVFGGYEVSRRLLSLMRRQHWKPAVLRKERLHRYVALIGQFEQSPTKVLAYGFRNFENYRL
ncbi:MAG TPA: hypothetical protein VF285_06960 [Castellaniella sp.]|uniref:hypothetical protein n=1 Tax=Castellaniella sp. TaxID=1955812 RepID=UPI002EDCB958